MGFWIYMFFMVLTIPAIMIIFGRIFMKKAPEKINWVFGYRTRRSMMNKDTWAFAHKYIGRLWWICGLVLLPLSVIPMLLLLGKDKAAELSSKIEMSFWENRDEDHTVMRICTSWATRQEDVDRLIGML